MNRPDPLPASIDAERTILGAILLDNAAYAESIKLGLRSSDFFLDSHRRIWLRMAGLMKDRRVVDIVTLAAELERCKEIKTVGGVAYLASLTEGLPRRPAITEYVRIVKEHTHKRDLLEIAESITIGIGAGDTPDEINMRALSTLERIGKNGAGTISTWVGEDMETFLADTESETEALIQDIIYRACLTELFAPRGIGKSILALQWAVILASRGLRVLILDRDNSRHTIKQRLRGFCAENLSTLKVISREKCPRLTQPEAWASFPYDQFDVVIVDSLDAMAEGVGEQDSAKPAKALAVLLDICHRENGPAVLVLGNTVKSGKHSRCSGVVEDRADIVYEARDATDFRPTGAKTWIEGLPSQGAAEWAARSARRKSRSNFRVALVASKFRGDEEPVPRILEARLGDVPYTVEDVTASVDADGERERLRIANEKQTRYQFGLERLSGEIERRAVSGEKPILKEAAEQFLMSIETAPRITRKEARGIVANPRIAQVKREGKGHPIELHGISAASQGEYESRSHGGNSEIQNPSKDAGTEKRYFRRPHLEHTAEIDPSQTRMNTGDLQPAISAADTPLTAGIPPAAEPGKVSGEGLFLDVEV